MKHIIKDRRAEIALGLAAFALGGLLLRDAYDNRGVDQPLWLRPLSFW